MGCSASTGVQRHGKDHVSAIEIVCCELETGIVGQRSASAAAMHCDVCRYIANSCTSRERRMKSASAGSVINRATIHMFAVRTSWLALQYKRSSHLNVSVVKLETRLFLRAHM